MCSSLPESEKPTGANQRATQTKQVEHTGNSTSAQRQRLLAALRIRPMNTLEIRAELDILGVAPRVFELRKRGHKILTHWRYVPTDCGKMHRVALYVLVKEARV